MTPELDPQARDLLDAARALGRPPIPQLSVEEARELMRATLVPKGAPPVSARIEAVHDVEIPTPRTPLQARLYHPIRGGASVALFLHGGGWTLNDLETHDYLCRRLTASSGCTLAALHFRRAPEFKHPAALEDAYVAYRWLLDNKREHGCTAPGCGLIGESSGATTAAALSLLLRDQGGPLPTYQALAYPAVDYFGSWPSYEERGTGYILDRDLIVWFMNQYLPGASGQPAEVGEPGYLFPIHAPDHAGLPPTIIMTAEFDPLRDEGIAYARRLAASNVLVDHIHATDQMHGFLLYGRAIKEAERLTEELGRRIRRRSELS